MNEGEFSAADEILGGATAKYVTWQHDLLALLQMKLALYMHRSTSCTSLKVGDFDC